LEKEFHRRDVTLDKNETFVLWFDEITKDDTRLVGGKSASLGEMTSKTKVPVPYGFALTAAAYRFFLRKNKLDRKIEEILMQLKDPNDTATLQRVGEQIRNVIISAPMPEQLEKVIVESYQELSRRVNVPNPYVAIRSSATAEDLPDASFAGQQETYLNISGSSNVVEKVRECYASLFTNRAIFYRIQKGFNHLAVALSAIVQMMCFSKAAGVTFTLDVSTGDRSVVMIEAAYGLGEFVVQGKITPDLYYVKKDTLEIVRKDIAHKTIMLARKPGGGTEEREVPEALRDLPVLSDDQIRELAKYSIAIEEHYGRPMDIEWGLDEQTGKLLILQARPETVWALKTQAPLASVVTTTEKKTILTGLPASPGIAVGKVRIVPSVEHINEFQTGEILVTEMTAPDWVPAMKKAKAIITNSGGMTCHAAIVSRELGIPCIVGSMKATEVLKTGMEVTVDAKRGVVYEGVVSELLQARPETALAPQALMVAEGPITGTKIYVNLGEPELAEKVSQLPVDGVGLLRMEFIVNDHIGKHPMWLLETGRPDEFVDKLAEGLATFCRAFHPRPVVLRFSDFKTNEYAKLQGGEKYETGIKEANPLLGFRGASRYTDPRYEPAFKLEIAAVKKVREEMKLTNLWCMIPFTRTVEEFIKIKNLLEKEGLRQSEDFKLWIMAEVPSNIILADEFCKAGVDGFSIGSNDLAMLILGADRDNEILAPLFDERNLAVKRAIKHLIDTAHKYGKTVSICGQAPSVYPEFTRFLIESGIDSVSVNPDVVIQTRKIVAQVEQRILLEKLSTLGKKSLEELSF
jgi:pyruvate,water dikinase